jgi:FKBP-type peptidyl-prolyl cis-trans isomerase FkpA
MKTLIGAGIAVVIIAAIVLLSRGHKAAAPVVETATPDASSTNGDPIYADGGPSVVNGTAYGAANGDSVTVNYTGKLADGTTFDSNVDPKFGHVSPFTFVLGSGMVIKGWDQGVLGMKVGEKRHLSIPAELGYGAAGMPPVIPGNATLEFDVEVVSIHHK